MRRLALALLAACTIGSAAATGGRAQQPLQSTPTPTRQPDEFGERVRAYLLAHPEVIFEAAQLYQQRQQAAQAETVKQTIASRADEILRDPAAPVGGNEAGDVTLVEFFDYNCKYCRSVAPTIAEVLGADPGLRLVYKEFPILGDGSAAAARVTLAAERQGKYHELHEALMGAAGSVTEQSALDAAAGFGLDMARLQADMADPAIAAAIARNQALAAELGINGTPGFVIGQEIVPGAIDRGTLEGAAAALLKYLLSDRRNQRND
jgi:protein-disulfide isomerase